MAGTDALLKLYGAHNIAVQLASGCGRVKSIRSTLAAAATAIAAEIRSGVTVDITDPYATVDAYVEAGGDIEELVRATEQRRFIENEERKGRQ